MEELNNSLNTTAAEENADPAEKGAEKSSDGKTFTQEEVNRIVSERLARERAKTEPDTKEQELSARENRLKCKEFIIGTGVYPPELLDVLDTNDFDKFKEQAHRLLSAFPLLSPKTPRFVPKFSGSTPGASPSLSEKISQVFKLNN